MAIFHRTTEQPKLKGISKSHLVQPFSLEIFKLTNFLANSPWQAVLQMKKNML